MRNVILMAVSTGWFLPIQGLILWQWTITFLDSCVYLGLTVQYMNGILILISSPCHKLKNKQVLITAPCQTHGYQSVNESVTLILTVTKKRSFQHPATDIHCIDTNINKEELIPTPCHRRKQQPSNDSGTLHNQALISSL